MRNIFLAIHLSGVACALGGILAALLVECPARAGGDAHARLVGRLERASVARRACLSLLAAAFGLRIVKAAAS